MSDKFDVAVVGGGPAGAAAAWSAAQSGARVVVLDKAVFPRDKPCGDGITPRAAALIDSMGLGDSLGKFHRIDGVRVFSPRRWEALWPARPGVEQTAYVARRLDLDELLLSHAGKAGAQVRQACRAIAPIMADGRTAGVITRDEQGNESVVRADVVIAADGVYSPIKRALAPASSISGRMAIAMRAEMSSLRPDDNFYEIYTRIRHLGDHLPGYGWVFPLGGGRVNIGIGYLTSYRHWQDVNAADVMKGLLDELPPEWELPSMEEVRRTKALRAWRLPTGFTVWPPHRPGVMFAGDAAGAVKPSNGAGISKALQSGLIAGECAVQALGAGGPGDLSDYGRRLSRLWGRQYRIGRTVGRVVGHPTVMKAACDLLDNPLARRSAIRVIYGGDAIAAYREGESR